MLRYVVVRLLSFIPNLLLISLFTFALGYYGPGDPVRVLMGEQWADEATYQVLRHQYGFDRPFIIQYFDFIGKAVRGDFGRSVLLNMRVSELLFPALGVTARLGLMGLASLAVLGCALGVLAAIKQNTWIDHLIVVPGIVLQSIPVFVLGPMLMMFLVLQLKVMNTPVGWNGILSTKNILPVFLLMAVGQLAVIRQTRESIINIRSSDFVRTAKAKGLPDYLILWRHILRNALTPVVTTLGILSGWLLTGSIFIESIFSIPGFGSLYYGALKTRDYHLLISGTLVASFVIMTINLIVDISYGFLDPRVRLSR